MRHRSRGSCPGTLHSSILHCRHPVRGLRCGDHFPLSLGGEIQVFRALWAARDADLPGYPDRRLHLDLAEGCAGVGVSSWRPSSRCALSKSECESVITETRDPGSLTAEFRDWYN